MYKRIISTALVSGFFFALVLSQAAPVRIALPPETARLREGAGADLVKAQCLLCHSADYISTQPRLSAAVWKATVVKMRDKYGAPVAEDKIDSLVQYLVANYGPEAPAK